MSMNSGRRRVERRAVLAAGAAAIGALVVPVASSWAQRRPPAVAEVSVVDLMKAGPLPDLAMGKADAPVTIVEYASMTCGHCANFHVKVFPALKEKYIDTGKVRFVFREFPLNNQAVAASMLARCTGSDEKAIAFNSVMFSTQNDWAFVPENQFVPQLFKMARQAGFTQEAFDKCLTDQSLLDKLIEMRERGSKMFGVESTPTFFINGKRLTDRSDQIESFDKALQAILPKT
jgi:protein-disulfide isomerase